MKLLSKYKNGNHNVLIYDNGSKIKMTINPSDDHFIYEFPESIDCKITNCCDAGCLFCHENSTINGKHADLKKVEGTINSLQPYSEIALGGGNLLTHPDLIWFLEKLKSKNIISNITINQRHLKPYKELIYKLVNDKLITGLGISLADSSDKEDFEFIDTLGKNVVIHTIAGILEEKDYDCLRNRKILILGYKDLRRGHDNLIKNQKIIEANIDKLKTQLLYLASICKIVSFDCLGIEQLNPKKLLNISDDKYDLSYQGHDYNMFDSDGNLTVGTMYMDLVNMQVSRSSTSQLNKRYSFTGTENIKDLLALTTKGY